MINKQTHVEIMCTRERKKKRWKAIEGETLWSGTNGNTATDRIWSVPKVRAASTLRHRTGRHQTHLLITAGFGGDRRRFHFNKHSFLFASFLAFRHSFVSFSALLSILWIDIGQRHRIEQTCLRIGCRSCIGRPSAWATSDTSQRFQNFNLILGSWARAFQIDQFNQH